MSHGAETCRCGAVLRSCRCPGPHLRAVTQESCPKCAGKPPVPRPEPKSAGEACFVTRTANVWPEGWALMDPRERATWEAAAAAAVAFVNTPKPYTHEPALPSSEDT